MQSRRKKKGMKALAIVHMAEQRAIYVLLATFVLLLFIYIYMLGSAVFATVMYKDSTTKIAQVHTQIADLEAEYLAEKNSLTEDSAFAMGLKVIEDKSFVNRIVRVGRAGI